MLSLSTVMIGSSQPKVLGEFYEKVLDMKPKMTDGDWSGWMVGSCFFSVGGHSEVKGEAKEPARVMINFESEDVKADAERIKKLGAKEIKAPYEMSGMWFSTFADPDGNYFQIVSTWQGNTDD